MIICIEENGELITRDFLVRCRIEVVCKKDCVESSASYLIGY